MGFEFLAPGGARVGEEDVDVGGCFGHFGSEALDFGDFGGVGRDGDGGCAGAFVLEGIEGSDCFFAGRGFARGYVDFATAGLEETGGKFFLTQEFYWKFEDKVREWESE